MLVKKLVNSNYVKNCLVVLILTFFGLNSVCLAKDSQSSISNKTVNQERTVNKTSQRSSAITNKNQIDSLSKSNSGKQTENSSISNNKESVKDSTPVSANEISEKSDLSNKGTETDEVLNEDNSQTAGTDKSIGSGSPEDAVTAKIVEIGKDSSEYKDNSATSNPDKNQAAVSGNSGEVGDPKTETADKASASRNANKNSEVLESNPQASADVVNAGIEQTEPASQTSMESTTLSHDEPVYNDSSSMKISGTDKSITIGNQENENSEITKTPETDEAISKNKENSAVSNPGDTDHVPVSGTSDKAEDSMTEAADKTSTAAPDITDNSEDLKTSDTNNTATADAANAGTEQPVHTSQTSNETIFSKLSQGETENNNEGSVLSSREKTPVADKSNFTEIILNYIALIAILFVFWFLLNRSIKLSVKRECEKIASDAFKSIDEKKTSLELYEQVCGILLHSSDNSYKLFEKYIELSQSKSDVTNSNDTDNQALLDEQHEIVKLVANRICFMKVSLSRMDPSVKGYKQLKKSIDQIFDNLMAKGYEIIDYLGMPYNEGMKVTASFIPDEDLPEGQRIVTGVIKPQVNYQNEMIQAAQITVSQNID